MCELVTTEQLETGATGQIDKIQLTDQAGSANDHASALDLQLSVGDLDLKLNCHYSAQDLALATQIQLLERELQQCQLQLKESQQLIGFLQARILSQQEQITKFEL